MDLQQLFLNIQSRFVILRIPCKFQPTCLVHTLAFSFNWMVNQLSGSQDVIPSPKPIILMGFSVHGVFPKRQKQLAQKLGNLVANELVSSEQITEKIKLYALNDESMKMLEKKIEGTMRNKLVSAFPMLSMFLSDDMVKKVTSIFREDLKAFISESVHQLSSKIDAEINIEDMVSRKVEAFSSSKLEKILYQLMRKEFKIIEIVGAILGFLIGCLQLALSLLGLNPVVVPFIMILQSLQNIQIKIL